MIYQNTKSVNPSIHRISLVGQFILQAIPYLLNLRQGITAFRLTRLVLTGRNPDAAWALIPEIQGRALQLVIDYKAWESAMFSLLALWK